MMHNARVRAQRALSRAASSSGSSQSTPQPFLARVQAILASPLPPHAASRPFPRSFSAKSRSQQQRCLATLKSMHKSTSTSTPPPHLAIPANLAQLMKSVPRSSLKANTLRAITVGAAADQFEASRQQQHDFSLHSADIQKFHDSIVSRRVPFNSTIDVEFTLKDLKTTTIWTSNSLVDLIKSVVMAPWEMIQYIWGVGVKVYLRFTKQFDAALTPWVYQLLDLKVPLEDLIFNIKDFSPEEHQLYLLITHILRFQMVVELALKEAIQRTPFPNEFIKQQEEKAAQLGMNEDEFRKQVESSRQAFQKQKLRALQQLQLIGIPEDFSPDDDTIELIQNFDFPDDFPIEQVIAEPRLGLELIRRLVTEQLSQIPMPQMATMLEFKGLSQALRSLQQPEHFAEYKRLFNFVSSPDMTLRRQLRALSLQGTSKDYERVRMTVVKQLQHIRRVIKTYQRQQAQIKEFGFIVKRRRNFNPNDPKLSRIDRAMFMQDVEQGIFASIDDIDPEEEAEGSLIADEPGLVDPTTRNNNGRSTNRQSGDGNERMLARRDRVNRRRAEQARPLTEEDLILTLRVLALSQQRDDNPDFRITEESLSDGSNDEELMDAALQQYNGDIRALESELRPIFYDIRRGMSDDDNDDDYYDDSGDYDDDDDDDDQQDNGEFYDEDEMPGQTRRRGGSGSSSSSSATNRDAFPENTNRLGMGGDDDDEYDPAAGLDPIHDDEYDDERYLSEHLTPMKKDYIGPDGEFDNDKWTKDQRKQKRRDDLSSQYRNEGEAARNARRDNNNNNNNNPDNKKKGKRALPAHIVRDPNPKIISRKWFNEAMAGYEQYQDRLRYVERLMMERDFQTKDKYLQATRYFSSVLLDESNERAKSVKLQQELQSHVSKMFDALPDDIKQQYFIQRYEFEHKIAALPKDQQEQLKQQKQSQSAAVAAATTDATGAAVPGVDLSAGVKDLPDLSTMATTVSVPPSITPLSEGPSATTTTTAAAATTTTTTTTTPAEPQIDLSKIPMQLPKPRNRQEELEQTNDMLQVIQAYQLQTFRDQYALQELDRAHQREEMRIVGRHEDILQRANAQQRQKVQDARLRVAKERLEQQRAIAAAQAEGKPIPEFPPLPSLKDQLDVVDRENIKDGSDELDSEIQRIQDEIAKINVKLTPGMAERALQRAVQHTELPLIQQLSLIRMKNISPVELYNSEMLDIMYTSLRDFLQTSLYDANQHNVMEHSVSGLMLSVLNAPKSVESYDDMSRFNESVEDQVNKPRAVVNKLTTLQRKWLLMSLQQEHQLNQFYPIGQLPPILPFLSNPQREAKLRTVRSENDVLLQHDEEFKSIPLTRAMITQRVKINHAFGDDSTPTALRNAPQQLPLFTTDLQLQDQAGDYYLSEQSDKFIVSPVEITADLFDSRYDIISQKHLLNQLKRVRDRRLRELLQLIGMIGTDPQVLAPTTKFHIKQLEPALNLAAIPENLVVYLTKYYTHRSIATTLDEMIRVLSSMRKQVTEKQVDYSLTEYDVTLQYCMDLYQYHIKQLQLKVPDFYTAQFRALDLSMVGLDKAKTPWRPEFERPLSLKELNAVAFGNDIADV